MKKNPGYEGLQENVRKLKTPPIDVWENKYPDKEYTVSLDVPEFTCICPKTGLPEFAAIKIEYSPAKYCIELKSFKMYTIFFRDVGIFHEHFINTLMEDLIKACQPRRMKIIGVFNPRGGITTTVAREYKKR